LKPSYTADGSILFQWYKNGKILAGEVSEVLSLKNISANDGAAYSVSITNDVSVAFAYMEVVVQSPPVIQVNPAPQSSDINGSAIFSVQVTGSGPFTYQWMKNGVNISGATGANYTIPVVSQFDYGYYSVKVTNSMGAITTNPVFLNVDFKELLVGSYPIDGTSSDISPSLNHLKAYNVYKAPDRFGNADKAGYFDGNTSWMVSTSNVPISGSSPRTMSLWIKTDPLSFYKGNPVILGLGNKTGTNTLYDLTFFSNNGSGQSWSAATGAYIWNHTSNGGFSASTTAQLITSSQWFHIAMTSDGTRGGSRLFINGAEQPIFGNAGTWATVLGKLRISSGSDTSGPVNDSVAWWNQGFKGYMDDIRLYNRVLSVEEINGLYKLESPRLTNLSVRTSLEASQNVIVGFTMTGGEKNVLMRAVGPTLSNFGVPNVMNDPKLDLYNGSAKVESNDNWGGATSLSSVFSSVGAFSYWSTSSLDAALLSTISGGRTLQVSGPASGAVLVEAYDAGVNSSARFSNLSARNKVGMGADILIAGFTLSGNGARKLLIRAVGPTLGSFGVSGVLMDPKLELYSGTTKIAENDTWSSSLSGIFSSVGAFGLTAGSKDAALVVSLPAGGYTVQVSGADGGVGEAIVEIYELP